MIVNVYTMEVPAHSSITFHACAARANIAPGLRLLITLHSNMSKADVISILLHVREVSRNIAGFVSVLSCSLGLADSTASLLTHLQVHHMVD